MKRKNTQKNKCMTKLNYSLKALAFFIYHCSICNKHTPEIEKAYRQDFTK